jgi:hypothetical protein
VSIGSTVATSLARLSRGLHHVSIAREAGPNQSEACFDAFLVSAPHDPKQPEDETCHQGDARDRQTDEDAGEGKP